MGEEPKMIRIAAIVALAFAGAAQAQQVAPTLPAWAGKTCAGALQIDYPIVLAFDPSGKIFDWTYNGWKSPTPLKATPSPDGKLKFTTGSGWEYDLTPKAGGVYTGSATEPQSADPSMRSHPVRITCS